MGLCHKQGEFQYHETMVKKRPGRQSALGRATSRDCRFLTIWRQKRKYTEETVIPSALPPVNREKMLLILRREALLNPRFSSRHAFPITPTQTSNRPRHTCRTKHSCSNSYILKSQTPLAVSLRTATGQHELQKQQIVAVTFIFVPSIRPSVSASCPLAALSCMMPRLIGDSWDRLRQTTNFF